MWFYYYDRCTDEDVVVYGEMEDGNEEKNQNAVDEEKNEERDEEEEEEEEEEVDEEVAEEVEEEVEGGGEETLHKSGTSTKARILSEAVTKVCRRVFYMLSFPTPFSLLLTLYSLYYTFSHPNSDSILPLI